MNTETGWYVYRDQQRWGPYSWQQMLEMAQRGNVKPADRLWHAQYPNFINANQVQGLFVSFKPTESAVSAPPKPPPDAWEHYDRAESIKYKDEDKSVLNEKAAEYALAIKKANGFFPAAHAQLGATFLFAGFEDRAKQELNTAVQQENCNTAARFYLIMMDIDKLGMPKVPENTGSLLIDVLSFGGGFAVAQGKVNNLSNKIDELIKAFHDDVSETDNIEYWLSRSEMLIMLHDEIQRIKSMPRKDRLAQAVINAPWEKVVVSPEFEQKVNDVKRRAEGRALLAK